MTVGGSREALSDSFARKMASWDPVEALASGACGAEWMLVAGGRAAMGPPESKSWSSSIDHRRLLPSAHTDSARDHAMCQTIAMVRVQTQHDRVTLQALCLFESGLSQCLVRFPNGSVQMQRRRLRQAPRP